MNPDELLFAAWRELVRLGAMVERGKSTDPDLMDKIEDYLKSIPAEECTECAGHWDYKYETDGDGRENVVEAEFVVEKYCIIHE